MKFIVLQHINVEHPGIFRDFMKNDGIGLDTIELDEGDPIPEMDGYDAMIVMGGPMDTWEEEIHPWLITEKTAIRHAIMDLKMPYLGFCLGHQLMAAALGGTVGKMARPEVGILDIELNTAGQSSLLFSGLPDRIKTLQWHGAEVTEPPPDSVILARSPLCAIQALQYGDTAFSMQCHIEITDTTVTDWGKVPVYKESLEQTLGDGSLEILNDETLQNMTDFNHSARIIYNNFMQALKRHSE
jgi:GMP synthase-like glutamine amidotransferase